jgi:hypothetical protein
MTDADLSAELMRAAALLYGQLHNSPYAVRAGELEGLIHDAEAREHRRAAFNARDAACYRLGSAFEPTNGLGLDPAAFAGWLAMGNAGLLLLLRQAAGAPEHTITESLAALFASPAGQSIRAWGVWARWHWLKALYIAETEGFLASPAAKRRGWKQLPPTARQTYLIAAICADLQKELQRFESRGAASDWILAQGGNPRFNVEPAKPDLSDFAELVP